VLREGLALGVPEGIHEDLVVFDRHGVHARAQVERSLLEQHAVLVVHAPAIHPDDLSEVTLSLPHSIGSQGGVFEWFPHSRASLWVSRWVSS